MKEFLSYLAGVLIWAVTLAFEAFMVAHGQPLSGWIGVGGFVLGAGCIGLELL